MPGLVACLSVWLDTIKTWCKCLVAVTAFETNFPNPQGIGYLVRFRAVDLRSEVALDINPFAFAKRARNFRMRLVNLINKSLFGFNRFIGFIDKIARIETESQKQRILTIKISLNILSISIQRRLSTDQNYEEEWGMIKSCPHFISKNRNFFKKTCKGYESNFVPFFYEIITDRGAKMHIHICNFKVEAKLSSLPSTN